MLFQVCMISKMYGTVKTNVANFVRTLNNRWNSLRLGKSNAFLMPSRDTLTAAAYWMFARS
jgi:hypothetical protein